MTNPINFTQAPETPWSVADDCILDAKGEEVLASSECMCGTENLQFIVDCVNAQAEFSNKPPQIKLCEGCPPVGYPTDKTRCGDCPRRAM